MLKKVFAVSLVVIFTLLMIVGCTPAAPAPAAPAAAAPAAPAAPADPTEPAAQPEDPPRELIVGYLAWNLENVWNQFSSDAFLWAAEQRGVSVHLMDARGDAATQVTQAQDMITLGVDAIGLYPVTPESGATIVRMANEAGIPIAVENVFLPDDTGLIGQVACIYSDIGFDAMSFIAETWPSSRMLFVHGLPGIGLTEEYFMGVDAGLAEYGDRIVEVARINGLQTTEGAFNVTEDFINAGLSEFDVVFAQNDSMAYGVFMALRDHDMLHIPIVSTGGSPIGYQMMLDGQQFANVTAPVNIQGITLFDFLWRHLNGVQIPPDRQRIPLPTFVIVRETMDQWITWDNFQAAYNYIGGLTP